MKWPWQHTHGFMRTHTSFSELSEEVLQADFEAYLATNAYEYGRIDNNTFYVQYSHWWSRGTAYLELKKHRTDGLLITLNYTSINIWLGALILAFSIALPGKLHYGKHWILALIGASLYTVFHELFTWVKVARVIREYPLFVTYDAVEQLSRNQQEWIRESEKCPACGNTVSAYEQYCSDCGLLVHVNPKIWPVTASTYRPLNYEYKSPKK